MEYFDAFMQFLKAIFNALTNFLGKSIPVISDIDSKFLTAIFNALKDLYTTLTSKN